MPVDRSACPPAEAFLELQSAAAMVAYSHNHGDDHAHCCTVCHAGHLAIVKTASALRTLDVGEAPKGDAVAPGTVVTIHFDDDTEDTETFLLGSREIAATTDLTVYSPESALGKSILGARAGDTVTYTAPTGKDIKVTVVTFAPFTG